jgi:CRISPR system Cascade subunit CasB
VTETLPLASPRDAEHGRRERPRYAAALSWWSALQPYREDGSPNPQADRGALARLRRAASPADILDEEAVFDLHRRLGFGRRSAAETLPQVAVVGAVLAHVREHDRERPPARAVGRQSLGDAGLETAAMSPLRMRRLLQAREPDDVLRQMRRLVDLADRRVDVGALAELILDWLNPERGDRARSLFAYDYYAAGGPKPGTATDRPHA